jgi:hypothetical protein
MDNCTGEDAVPTAVLPQDPAEDSEPEVLDSDTEEDSATEDLSKVEVKSEGLNSHLAQIVAQTIVFSFHQKKHFPMLHFVPSIAISQNAMQFHFYDSEKDLYFVTGELELFDIQGDLHLNTVLITWLVLNHRLFMSEGTEEMKRGTKSFRFHSFAKDKLDLYRHDIEMGSLHIKPECFSIRSLSDFLHISETSGEYFAEPKTMLGKI